MDVDTDLHPQVTNASTRDVRTPVKIPTSSSTEVSHSSTPLTTSVKASPTTTTAEPQQATAERTPKAPTVASGLAMLQSQNRDQLLGSFVVTRSKKNGRGRGEGG